MIDRLRQLVLRWMRVPPDPEPPLGAPESVRVFRAGRNYYKLRVARWAVTQVGAVIGILFSLAFLAWFRGEVTRLREFPAEPAMVRPAAPTPAAPATTAAPAPGPAVTSAPAETAPPTKGKARNPRVSRDPRQNLRQLAQRTPNWALILIEVFELGGILLFLVQLPVTFAAVRLEFELHWYIVTDRSLRIRTGLFRLQESTMSFANLQQVEVKQGPIQRLLGLADLRVQSAGGSSGQPEQPGHESLHTGVFHSVENASAIRDLILERLRKFRETGLGDPDDHGHHPEPAATPSAGDALTAAHELLAEARELRRVLNH